MNDTEAESKPAKRGIVMILVMIGVLFLVSLPFLPWFLRGISQSGVEKAVKAVNGRASYGKKLFEEGDYYTDEKSREKTTVNDIFGDAFTEQLTLVELTAELTDRSLMSKLKKLRYLEILDASAAKIDDEMLAALAGSESLKKLWMNGSSVTSAGLQTVSTMPNMMSLGLEETAIDNSALGHFTGLTSLKRLYLAKTSIDNDGVAKLTSLSSLLGIGLEGTKVTDQVVDHLVKLSALKELRLGHTSITDVGASKLGALSNLQSVYLDHTAITENGLKWLAHSENLEIVVLSGSKVSDAIADTLVKMPKLVSVHLHDTAVSEEAVTALRRQLGNSVQVQSQYSELATQ